MRRAQLLDAAVEAIAAIGPGATMEQLARQGGVTKPILYRHFGDRQGLIIALAERFSVSLMTEIETRCSARPTLRGLLDSTIDAYLALHRARPVALPLPPARTRPPQAGGPRSAPSSTPSPSGWRSRSATSSAPRSLDSGAAVPWAYGIVGLVHQAGDWWLDDQTMTREQLVRYLTNLLWSGLEAAANAVTRVSGT